MHTFQQLETFAFDFLSGNGDYLDIRNFVSPEDRPDVTRMTKEELLSLVRCLLQNGCNSHDDIACYMYYVPQLEELHVCVCVLQLL